MVDKQRYDVLAVSKATGLVKVEGLNCNRAQAWRIARDGAYEKPRLLWLIVPTGTYKDGDHYPKEEA